MHDWRPAAPLPAPGTFESVMDQLKSLQMRKKEEALAVQEVHAENLMQTLTYADVCSRMLTYAHVCSRMLTYARSWTLRS